MNLYFKYVTLSQYITTTKPSLPIKLTVVQLVNIYFHFHNCLKRV